MKSIRFVRDAFFASLPGRMVVLAIAIFVGGAVGTCALSGCVNGKLTPTAAAVVEGAFKFGCPLEGAIPVLGSGLASACPGEEAWLSGVLTKYTAQPLAIAPSSARAGAGADAGPPKPVALFRMSSAGLVHCGWAHPDIAPGLQRAMLAASILDAGADR